ncbi:MAG TPA: CDP-diacylglycerol--glycerol-3-phosphate 3-phosphatidyltransferase [Alphaproteobacteria bacterium]|nr:CDP-diacylglycerol--glycerol-3-phosphate 3-phosphatidyltransferase [Alphaproteobacteria bacterium]
MLSTLPMTLTLSRIIAIPVLVALFYVPGDTWRYIACALYTAAAITDYLDGYIARAWKQQSKLGRIFDPIADKLLVGAVILMLVASGRISGLSVLAALVILCREILVSGLREFLAEIRAHLPVSRLAKWKTGIQMTALGFLIVGDASPTSFLPVTFIGDSGLWIAAALTLVTGYDYLVAGLKHIDEVQPVRETQAKSASTPAVGSARRTG